jgi:hypothetical protein
MPGRVDPNAHDRFLLRQRIRLMVNQYEFALPSEDGTSGDPFCFVERVEGERALPGQGPAMV